jgi:hypothetical protein
MFALKLRCLVESSFGCFVFGFQLLTYDIILV